MNYIDRTKRIIDELVAETFKATQSFIATEIQPLSKEQLNKLAFDAVLRDVKKLEREAGLASRN